MSILVLAVAIILVRRKLRLLQEILLLAVSEVPIALLCQRQRLFVGLSRSLWFSPSVSKARTVPPELRGYRLLLSDWILFVGRFCVLDCTTFFGAARRSASLQVSELVVATGMELADLTTDIIACVHVMNGTISMPSRSA